MDRDVNERALSTREILSRRDIIGEHLVRTPLRLYDPQPVNGNRLYGKFETQQHTGSFKFRGGLMATEAAASVGFGGVAGASTGNHSSGLGEGARIYGLEATIFMPAKTPPKKQERTRETGANVVLVAGELDDAIKAAKLFEAQHADVIYIDPYDNRDVISGQSTVALEILQQLPDIDRLILTAGGFGLGAGCAEVLASLKPDTKLTIPILEGNDSVSRSFSGERKAATSLDTICEGSSVQMIGKLNHQILKLCGNKLEVDFVTVTRSQLGRVIKAEQDIFCELEPAMGPQVWESFPEPTALLSIAGAYEYARLHPEVQGENWVSILTGSNYDPDKVSELIQEYEAPQLRINPNGTRVTHGLHTDFKVK